MNRSDSERIAAVLEKMNFLPALNEKEADLVVINICSVRQSAVDRAYGKISDFAKSPLVFASGSAHPAHLTSRDVAEKIQIKNRKIILTGCILERDKKKLKDRVDLIVDIKSLTKLPKKISNLKSQISKPNLKSQNYQYFKIRPKYSSGLSAYLPIMTGCDSFCSYCVVPYVRGREFSRPAEEILNEIKNLISREYKEIILLGQNVNRYRSQIDTNLDTNNTNINFTKLLQLIEKIPGKFWLRFLTNHPKNFSDQLIETIVYSKKICPSIHLPIQSGDDRILKKMNRNYTVKYYKNLISKIRKKIPNLSLSTDIIVGFPSETKKQFLNTKKLMEKIKFDMAYVAEYSPRSSTTAYNLKDDVSKKEKESRRKILIEVLKKTALENNKKYLNKTVEILTDGKIIKDFVYGKTKTGKDVRILANSDLSAGFYKVKITEVTSWGLTGLIEN